MGDSFDGQGDICETERPNPLNQLLMIMPFNIIISRQKKLKYANKF